MDEVIEPRRNGPLQRKKGKRIGWTKAKREVFLTELAASCNIRRASAAAAMGQTSAYRLRRRDPEFAKAWQAALEIGYERLETALVRRALEAVGEISIDALDERAELIEKMPVDQAIHVLRFHRDSVKQGYPRTRRSQQRHVATQAETDAVLIKRIGMVERQRAAREAGGSASPRSE